MNRVAFKMKLKEGFAEEYKKRHDEIWPELGALLTASGVSDYSIFLDEETNTLFAVFLFLIFFIHSSQVQKVEGEESKNLASQEIVKKWWAYMADIMDTNPDLSPVCVPLKEVFYLK